MSANPSPLRLISLNEVERRVGRSRWWIREKILEKKFPAPVNQDSRRVNFVEHEIDEYIARLIEERDRAAAKPEAA